MRLDQLKKLLNNPDAVADRVAVNTVEAAVNERFHYFHFVENVREILEGKESPIQQYNEPYPDNPYEVDNIKYRFDNRNNTIVYTYHISKMREYVLAGNRLYKYLHFVDLRKAYENGYEFFRGRSPRNAHYRSFPLGDLFKTYKNYIAWNFKDELEKVLDRL